MNYMVVNVYENFIELRNIYNNNKLILDNVNLEYNLNDVIFIEMEE